MEQPIVTENELIEQALHQPQAAEEFRPTDLHLDRRDGLKIVWADGKTSHYPLALLRKACPCAGCRTERESPKPAASPMSLTVLPAGIDRATQFAGARMVGHYAIQIDWADGHTTGIYDFRYLRLIAPA